MAMTLKLVRLDDFTSDIDSVDLTAGGYSLALDGYQPTVAADGDYSVTESITINIQSTSTDALATLVQALDTKIKQIGWWIDDQGVEKYQVWLRVGLNGESNTRQAMLLSIKPPEQLPLFNRLIDNNFLLASYTFAIERTPYWEGAPITEVNKTGLNALGGSTALSAAVNGDVPARLQRVKIATGSELMIMSNAWIGFKTSRFGTAANFISRWGLSGGIYGDDTSGASDSTASTGTRVVTTFAGTPGLEWRVNARLAVSASVNPSDQRGTYQVLLRARMNDSASKALVRIGYGFNINHLAYRARVVVSGSLWHLYEVGTVKIPPYRTYNYNDLTSFIIGVYAQRGSGTGSLYMDCLVLIPIDDGAIGVTTKPGSLTGVGGTERIAVYQAPDGAIHGTHDWGSASHDIAVTQPQGSWSAPNDATAPLIVVAADDYSFGSVLNDTVNVSYIYIPRWRTLRGSVT
jgi:hypothetical protein